MRTSFFGHARGLLLLASLSAACAEGTSPTFGDPDTSGGGGSGATGGEGPGSGAAGGPGHGSGASGPGVGGQGGQGGQGAGGNGGTAGEGGTGGTTTTTMMGCGDTICNAGMGENCTTCVADCGVCCGDTICDPGLGETTASCPADCMGGTTTTGMGMCTHDACTAGTPLDPSCNATANIACNLLGDTICCTQVWDEFCVIYGIQFGC